MAMPCSFANASSSASLRSLGSGWHRRAGAGAPGVCQIGCMMVGYRLATDWLQIGYIMAVINWCF
jgi:hypothetical protein